MHPPKPHPKDHPDANVRLGWMLKDIHHKHTSLVQSGLNSIGLHFGHPRILFTIRDLSGASQKDLSERLRVTPATLTVSLQRLEKAGFLQRHADERDQRANKIDLTAKGRQAIETCRQQMHAIDALMLEGFSDDEKTQLTTFFDRLYDNLSNLNAEIIADAADKYLPENTNPEVKT